MSDETFDGLAGSKERQFSSATIADMLEHCIPISVRCWAFWQLPRIMRWIRCH